MSGRAKILDKLKSHYEPKRQPGGPNPAQERIEAHVKNLIPARGRLDRAQRIDLFRAEADKVNASITMIDHYDAVPTAVNDYLRDHQLPARLKIAPDRRLKGLDWAGTTAIDVSDGRAQGDDAVSLSIALGGVAETGTLVMASGPDTPTSLNFLPLDHIVVLDADDIAGDYEAVWTRLREAAAKDGKPGTLPRTVNWITGPSRTADIEQTLLLGAHGPQRLHIIILDAPNGG